MADDSTRIGSGSSGLAGIKQALGAGAGARTRVGTEMSTNPGPMEGWPNGPAGKRMLSPDTPVDSLDRNVRRGTYLDIFV